MAKPEIQQKNNVHKKINSKLVACWSINDDFYVGKPDCHYEALQSPSPSCTSRELWVEYKHIKELPKRADTLVTPKWSSQRQEEILTRKWRNRGNARAIIFVGSGRTCKAIIYNNPSEWNNGLTKTECEKRAVSLQDVANFIESYVTAED